MRGASQLCDFGTSSMKVIMKPTGGQRQRVPTATFFIDESGSKATANRCFVVAGIKTRHPDQLARAVRGVRDRFGYENEFKFGRLSAGKLRMYHSLIDVLAESDAHIAASVVDASGTNPFRAKAAWQAHAGVISQLILGNLNRGELVGVLMDSITTPEACSVGREVQRRVNQRLKTTAVVTAVSLDSKCNDLLQIADLVAGAIYYERTAAGRSGSSSTPKVAVARRLAASFEIANLDDGRSSRTNILTLRGEKKLPVSTLSLVRKETRVS